MIANLRAGVIGIGAMGRHHARIMRELDGVDLVAVADPGGDRFGVAPGYEVGRSVQHLIDARLDLAIVAVPTAYHEEVALALADAGVPTLVEKPVAASVEAGTGGLRTGRRPGLRRPRRALQPGGGRTPAPGAGR